MNTDTIVTILSYAIPIIVAWLIKSPLKKYVPARVSNFLETITPDQYAEIYCAVKSKSARRESAIEAVTAITSKYGVSVDEDTATDLVDYITKQIKRIGK